MKCVKNGVKVRFGSDGSHVYNGDKYECSCGATVILCIGQSYHEDPKTRTPGDIWMDLEFNSQLVEQALDRIDEQNICDDIKF
jgi:hypothetical protein